MNNVIKFSFSEWLYENEQVNEAIRAKLDPDTFSQADIVLPIIEPGDMIEYGPKTQHRGAQTTKYGTVQGTEGKNIVVQPLGGGRTEYIPASDLYEKEDMPAQHRQELTRLGAKRLWQKRTGQQRAKDVRAQDRAEKERTAAAQLQPRTPEISRSDIQAVKRILMGGGEQKPAQTSDSLAGIFSQGTPSLDPSKLGPLAGFRQGGDKLSRMLRQTG